MREKLIELIENAPVWKSASFDEACKQVADHLIANGVTVIPPEGMGEMSDGYHTFNELYHHRAVLFSVICNARPDRAWKSKLHDTGDMFDGMFIVGIETDDGQATYHYDIDPYWDMFDVPELERAPKWDGHTSDEAIERIRKFSVQKRGRWQEVRIVRYNGVKPYTQFEHRCSNCKWLNKHRKGWNTKFCPNCGADMRGEEHG